MKKSLSLASVPLALLTLAMPAAAHFSGFKSPGPGMHFTQGEPIVVFADLFDDRDGKGFIVCPGGQTVSNHDPPPDYSGPRAAQCSGGGTPVGWPQFELLIDGALQTDSLTNKETVPNTTSFDHNLNSSPIGYFRFSAPSGSLSPGSHVVVARGKYSIDGIDIATQDSLPITIFVDAPPAKQTVTLSADFTGAVDWENVIVVGNGHAVTASGGLVIHDSLVTGLSGIGGSVESADIQGSIFEDTGPLDITLGGGKVAIQKNEFRANNRLTFVADDPSVPIMLNFHGDSPAAKVFQANRVGAGQSSFGGDHWLIGGDTDAESNIFIGPRCVLDVNASNSVVRGNYSHHNYRGAWSQGFNFFYQNAGAGVLTEHNFIRDSSWPIQYLAGEFRYNVVYGYGHNWIRTTADNTSIHHNLFAPGGDGGLNAGIDCYGGESGILVYNNTFDGGGKTGDFAGPTINMEGGSRVASFRNNLVTFSRNQNNDAPGSARVTGKNAGYAYADYNAFYSPDNTNKTSYDFAGAGAHDVSGAGAVGVIDADLAGNPFAGARIETDENRNIDSLVDEAAVWQGTQKVSQVLALFRDRYTPAAGSPVIDTGDPADTDAQGRKADIGAIDSGGHDQDKLGKFGVPPSELVPPTVALTSPLAGASLTGSTSLAATATDELGGSGIVLVQFLVDGASVGQTAANPYSVSFNTGVLTNGMHAFSAKAWDAAGNSAVSADVLAETMNQVVTTAQSGVGGSASGAGGQPGTGGAGAGSGGRLAEGSGGAPTTTGSTQAGTGQTGAGAAHPASANDSDSAPSGCGCRVTGASPSVPSWIGIGLAIALLGVRRRDRTARI